MRLVNVKSNILNIEDVDIVDATPLLDIKPYVPEFDITKAERIGWLYQKAKQVGRIKADKRFKS